MLGFAEHFASETTLQGDLTRLHSSSDENELTFNISKPYEECLQSLNLYPSEYRHLAGDLLMTFGMQNTPIHLLNYFVKSNLNTNLRGNNQNFEIQHRRMDCMHTVYTLRIVEFRDSLPTKVV